MPSLPSTTTPIAVAPQGRIVHALLVTRTLAWSEFKLRYAGSSLGYFWSIAKPLMMFSVLYVVFHKFLRLGAGIPRFPEMMLLGIVLWTFFQETTNSCVAVLVQRADMLRKVSFPAIALPIAVTMTSTLAFLINLGTVLTILVITGVDPTASWIWTPLLLLQLYLTTLGASLILSSMFVTMRDIGQVWDVLGAMLFYATPILYPLSLIPVTPISLPFGADIKVLTLVMMNPLAQIIEQLRRILVLEQSGSIADLLPGWRIAVPVALSLLIFFIGWWMFARASRRMIEVL